MRLLITTLLAFGLYACDGDSGGGGTDTFGFDTTGFDVGGGVDTTAPSGCGALTCDADGLLIELTAVGGGAPPDGSYRVTFLSVDPPASEQCDFVLPASGADPACRVGDHGVRFDGLAPSEPTIIIARDGGPAYSGKQDPITYTTSRPNGDGCPPVCSAATVTLEVN